MKGKGLTTQDTKKTICKTCDIRGLKRYTRQMNKQKYFPFGVITEGITCTNIHFSDREMPFFNWASLAFRIKLSASAGNLPKMQSFSIFPIQIYLRLHLLRRALDKQTQTLR